MGSEIVYCAKCATRLGGHDFERGQAVRIDLHVYCKACAPADAAPAAPEPARHTARAVASSSRHPRAVAPAPRPAWPWAVAGGIALLLAVVIAAGSASRPTPAPAATPAPAPAPRAGVPPRTELAKPLPAPEVGRLEEAVDALLRSESYAEALRLCQEASGWRTDEAGMRRVLALRTRTLGAARDKLAGAVAEASAARMRRDEAAVGRARDRVSAWGVPELSTEFERGLPRAPEAPWRPIFDGKSPAFLGGGSETQWKVIEGALERPGGDDAAQSRESFGDAEIRFRFEGLETSIVRVTIRQGPDGAFTVPLNGADARGTHELRLRCKGPEVTAELDGRAAAVEANGRPREGRLQFSFTGGRLRVLSIEARP